MTVKIIHSTRSGKSRVLLLLQVEAAAAAHARDVEVLRRTNVAFDTVIVDELMTLAEAERLGMPVETHMGPDPTKTPWPGKKERRCAQWKQERNAHRRNWR